MKDTTFKTNIKCDACVAKVTPYLDEVAGKGSWQVDLKDPERKLHVPAEVAVEAVQQALQQAGYTAEPV
ncbi:heavy metal transport/detoxification protein [Pedobacter sp. BS3]|uniref:heavy-metal-associated domain-containing protein n=1 Tax=Pedobacter sp. BS3 TaxID=2567937 RepID=UPI0011EE57FF|nr:heavy metal transport/detoxification protein [Pedobacter sp. BS3]TZF84630.1 heavy metal transport/detoxification protein [Pedobacter sp. BS3]